MTFKKPNPWSCALACLAVALASCGGGGGSSEGGVLSGSVVLQASAEIATPSSLSAVLPAGASGQPQCVLDSGQIPPGMSLTGCTLQGTPSQTGSYVSQLTLTIPGYTGSMKVDATVFVAGPFLGPSPVPTGTGLPLNAPVSGLSIFGLTTTPPFTLRPTDSLVYRIVSGRLPTGLNFDSASGLISGTPTQSGFFPLTVGATLTRGSATFVLADYATVGVSVLSF